MSGFRFNGLKFKTVIDSYTGTRPMYYRYTETHE